MKKVILATVFTALLLGGCSSNSDKDKSAVSSSSTATSSSTVESTVESSSAVESVVDRFAGQEEIGEGSFDLINQSGSTADGADIVIYYDANTVPASVDVSTADINGSLLSYIYVDGQLITSEQLGTSQTAIELQDTPIAIKEGKHTVQLVQYDSDKEDGNITTFKTQEYTLKLK